MTASGKSGRAFSDVPSAEKAILHVDMDAFFASVEALVSPELRNRPLIVGGDGARGVVASCSYEARAYGIRSAMPSARAKRLCPHATFVNGRYWLYEKYSKEMHGVFQRFTPHIEPLSLDEAFLDVTGAQRLFGTPTEIAWLIRETIQKEVGLTACIGVANTKHLAKLASVAAKPKATKAGPVDGIGVLTIKAEDAIDFLHNLPVGALWGVGPKSRDVLARIGITTTGQLARFDPDRLAATVGKATAEHLLNLAWNRDFRDVVSSRGAKSIGHEQTYSKDIANRADLHRQFVRLADAVATRLRNSKQDGRTVTVKIRYGNFETITRRRTLPKATSNAATMVEIAEELTAAVEMERGVRLAGISMSGLVDMLPAEQLTLGSAQEPEPDEEDPRRRQLDGVVDSIRSKYGATAVVPGQLIDERGASVIRRGDQQWGPTKEPPEKRP